MSNHVYEQARNEAWRLLIRIGANCLPVDPIQICKQEGIEVFSYEEGQELISALKLKSHAEQTDGFAVAPLGKKLIFYNQNNVPGRRRFTIAHELGHYLCGDVSFTYPTVSNREPEECDSETERRANMLAARILSPACVLWGCHVSSAEQTGKMCYLSDTAAFWRWKRLQELYEREKWFLKTKGRSCFLQHPLERMVYKQFQSYIQDYNTNLL